MRPSVYDRPARVEMLPLIDVVFLLLAVFVYSMVAMVRAHAVPVDLPQLVSGETQDLSVVLVVSVEEDGRVSMGGDELPVAEVEERMRARREASPELSVVINADRDARHGRVTEVLDAVRASGQQRVLIVGRPASGAKAD